MFWHWDTVVLWLLTRLSRGNIRYYHRIAAYVGIPDRMAALCFNLPLSLLGMKVLGPQFGVKTFVCFILVAVFADSIPAILLTLMGEPIPVNGIVGSV